VGEGWIGNGPQRAPREQRWGRVGRGGGVEEGEVRGWGERGWGLTRNRGVLVMQHMVEGLHGREDLRHYAG
jgi:hypothetical protein